MRALKIEDRPQLADLLGDVRREIDISLRSRIFCNRNLKMQSIEFIGFDMDYTLARYHQDRLEQLSIELTLNNMIDLYGYPPDILHLSYDSSYAIRGLVVDRKLGNIFKMDRHGYVGRVFHGFHQLTKAERRQHYRHERISLSNATRYNCIDTLFALPEVTMYITLVDYFDRLGSSVDYNKLFLDIRAGIDLAHSNNTLKSIIKSDVAGYIIKDAYLADTLQKLRSSGKKLFLLTNSHYPYTDDVMSYLLNGVREGYPHWQSYFDVIIVGGQKPGFFLRKEPFLLVNPNTGEAMPGEVNELRSDCVYQGGNLFDFERMTGAMGENVLYVGDHIYGDILRLKKAHVWRTAMVIQELDKESRIGAEIEPRVRDLAILDRRRRNLESEIDYQVLMLSQLQKLKEELLESDQRELLPEVETASTQADSALSSLRERARLMQIEVDALEDSIDRSYNPHWGPIFREGHENSRFGKQVSDYADLYTSRASNFLLYSPLRYFRAPRQQMPHEQ